MVVEFQDEDVNVRRRIRTKEEVIKKEMRKKEKEMMPKKQRKRTAEKGKLDLMNGARNWRRAKDDIAETVRAPIIPEGDEVTSQDALDMSKETRAKRSCKDQERKRKKKPQYSFPQFHFKLPIFSFFPKENIITFLYCAWRVERKQNN
jgi:hypothetical protein